MADSSKKPEDLVISYIVSTSGVDDASYGKVEAALSEGYRIANVIQSPMNAGGACNSIGWMLVTVVLILSGYSPTSPYITIHGKK